MVHNLEATLCHVEASSGSLSVALKEILLNGVLDTLKIIPFLFLTYLLMEFIEHKAGRKTELFIKKAGKLGPLVGAMFGIAPQCGFSAAASGLYAGGVVSVGTLVAVFLSTSDEMLALLVSESVAPRKILLILLYKVTVAIIVGFGIDLAVRKLGKNQRQLNIDAICTEENCHCDKGIFHSALHHTLTITAFLFAVTVAINALVYFVGEQALAEVIGKFPILSHLAAAVFGLVPNCAASVVLASLCTEGIISSGTMLAGLFSGAGVGLLVLFKTNRKLKENLLIVFVLVLSGFLFGMLFDLMLPNELLVI